MHFFYKSKKLPLKYFPRIINSKQIINSYKSHTQNLKFNIKNCNMITKNYKINVNNIKPYKPKISHRKTSNPKLLSKNKADLPTKYHKNQFNQYPEFLFYQIQIKLTPQQVFPFMKKCYNKK